MNDYTLLIENKCIAVIVRFGFGDQRKPHEWLADDNGQYFDNQGRDSRVFPNYETALVNIQKSFPNCKVIEL